MIPKTFLYRIEPGGRRRLTATIDGTSQWKYLQLPTQSADDQCKAARTIASSWRRLRYFPLGTTYEILQGGAVVASGRL